MGREIRQVPPHWEHPKYDDNHRHAGEYRPCLDKDYDTAAREWIAEFDAFMNGEHKAKKYNCRYFWEWESPPDEDTCRPAFDAEPSWFQVYETVTEGTPVTPPFATADELIDWLVEKGEKHGTKYERRYTREQARAFIEQRYAPSFVFSPQTGLISGIEACHEIIGKKEVGE